MPGRLPDTGAAPREELGALVRAARDGASRDRAFSELHRRFAAVVHGIALAHVGPADAEDVVQEVFLRVHRTIATLRDPVSFPAWVCTLARNVATDAARASRRRRAMEPLDDVHAAPGPSSADDALRTASLAAIATLPEAYRETLLLRLAEGLSGPEIAARTGLTPGSVRVNLCRGMERLRAALKERGVREEDLR